MSYLERLYNQPEQDYSPEFLKIDAESGPWFQKHLKNSIITQKAYKTWRLEASERVLWFGNEERNQAVAEVQLIGSYSDEDKKFIWAWTNPELKDISASTLKICEENSQVPEFKDALITSNEHKALTLSAAIAYKLGAESCYRLAGDLDLFVALFKVHEIKEDDPRSHLPVKDEKRANQALTEFAGTMALNLGGLIIDGLKLGSMDLAIKTIYRFCEKLEELSESPIGKDTESAKEAIKLAEVMKKAIMSLSLPIEHPLLQQGVRSVLSFLEDVAKEYGTWPTA